MNKLIATEQIARAVANAFNAYVWFTNMGDGLELHIAPMPTGSLPIAPGLVVITLDDMTVTRTHPFLPDTTETVEALVVSRVVDESDPSVGIFNGYGYANLTDADKKNIKFEHPYQAVKAAFATYADMLINEALGVYEERELDEVVAKAQRENEDYQAMTA